MPREGGRRALRCARLAATNKHVAKADLLIRNLELGQSDVRKNHHRDRRSWLEVKAQLLDQRAEVHLRGFRRKGDREFGGLRLRQAREFNDLTERMDAPHALR